ncbi:MAG: Gfo/Idh/MocA family oxidoreductase [Ruminococcaceae bacterium]|nr:Gfo/Idh/MocA family oxidoreductase [Oscillospiraceae bacterium]
MLNVALIGFGSISRVHRKAYKKLEEKGVARLTCAYDVDPEAFRKNVTNNIDSSEAQPCEELRFYTDLDELLANEKIDFADICVPTYLHKEMTVKLLRRGCHVLCEKPMALCYDDCEEMIRVATENQRQLMIGQCLRFLPAFDYLKTVIEEKRFGAVTGAFFSRLSSLPTWGWRNWFADTRCSGGGILDFHIHDVDMIRYLFGEPDAVSSRGYTSFSLYDAVHTSLFYDKIPVTAIADWTHVGMKFNASCYVNFEHATVSYDGAALLTVSHKSDKTTECIPLAEENGYYGEIAYFCDVVAGKVKNTKNPATSAATSVRLIERIRESADREGLVVRLDGNG